MVIFPVLTGSGSNSPCLFFFPISCDALRQTELFFLVPLLSPTLLVDLLFNRLVNSSLTLPHFLQCPQPPPPRPSVSLSMVLMTCQTFILTVPWSQNHVSVVQSHVTLLVSVCDCRGGRFPWTATLVPCPSYSDCGQARKVYRFLDLCFWISSGSVIFTHNSPFFWSKYSLTDHCHHPQ